MSDPYRPWDKNITIDELYEREKARGSDHRMTNWGASTPPGRTFWTQPPGADHNEGYCEAVEADPHDLNWPEIEEDIRRLCVHHRGMKTPDTQLVYDPANPDKQITFTVLRKRLEAIDKAKAMTYKPRGVYPNGTDGGEDAMADAHIQWQAGVRRAIKGEN